MTTEIEECNICGKKNVPYCPDGNCKECHVSISWEDCCDGTYNARTMMNQMGYTKEQIKELYPKAKV